MNDKPTQEEFNERFRKTLKAELMFTYTYDLEERMLYRMWQSYLHGWEDCEKSQK